MSSLFGGGRSYAVAAPAAPVAPPPVIPQPDNFAIAAAASKATVEAAGRSGRQGTILTEGGKGKGARGRGRRGDTVVDGKDDALGGK
jgi:hypothetical protein